MKLKSLLVVLLAGVALSGCHRMDPNSPEAKRQAIFKEMLRTSEDMGGMLRGRLPFDAEKFRAGSAKLHQLADQPWQYFPSPKAGEEGEDTRAKDEVWQRQQEFKAATQVFIARPRRPRMACARTSPRWKTPAKPATRNSARSEAGPGVIRPAWKARGVGRMSAGAHSPLRQRWAAPGVPLRRGWRVTPWASYALRGRREA